MSAIGSRLGIGSHVAVASVSASSASVKFPGKSAEFTVGKGHYDCWTMLHVQYGDSVRAYRFKGEHDALFSDVIVRGLRDGRIDFMLHCALGEVAAAQDYFQANGIVVTPESLISGPKARFLLQEIDDIRKAWPLLVQNNKFPDKQNELITRMVAEGGWLKVTPLRSGESYPANHSGPSARDEIVLAIADRFDARNLPDSHPQDPNNPY